MKEDKYTNNLAKNQVYAIVHIRDIRKKRCTQRRRHDVFVPFRGTNMASGKQQKYLFLSFPTYA